MRRAANWKIEALNLNKCPQCGAARQPHHVCPSCGFYNGELVVAKKTKKKAAGHEQQENAGETK